MVRVDTADVDSATRHRGGERPGGSDDAVADDTVVRRGEAGDAVDGERRGAGAVDLRAHPLQHRAEVDDLGLARGVVDDRGALGEHGGQLQSPEDSLLM